MDLNSIAALLPFLKQLIGGGGAMPGMFDPGGSGMPGAGNMSSMTPPAPALPGLPDPNANMTPATPQIAQNLGMSFPGNPVTGGPAASMTGPSQGAPMPGMSLQNYANVMKALHGLNADKGGAAWAPAFHWNPSAPANNAMRPSPARPAIGAMFASPAGQEALANLRQMMLGQDAGAGGGY